MEQELAQANANLPSGNAPTQRVINWGGVLKGVAIVGAIALVAVVALPAFTSLGASISGIITETPALQSIAAGIEGAATWIGDAATASVAEGGALNTGFNFVIGGLGRLGEMTLSGLGLAGAEWTGAAATKQAIGVAGAAATTALAAKAAMPTLQNLELGADVPVDVAPSTNTPVDHSMLAAQGAQTANVTHAASHSILHDATHAAHHAAEETNEHAERKWSDRFANRTAFASHTDAARVHQASRAIPQPAASFSEQLNADRANLDAALAK